MPDHFTISYSHGFEAVSDWLRARAAADPTIALGEGMHGNYAVVVTDSLESASWEQDQLDAGRTVSASSCVVEVWPDIGVIRVNQECGEEENAATASLIEELLKQFPDYSIYDEDAEENITARVRANFGELFGE